MDAVDYKLVGKKIQNRRRELGLSQEKLAECCYISTSYLGHIERGTRSLSMGTAIKLASVLDVSLDYLLLDTVGPTAHLLTSLEPILKKHSGPQVERFLRTVKVLAENIDKL